MIPIAKEGTPDFAGGGRGADVRKTAETGPPDRLRPLLATAEGKGLTEQTTKDMFVRVFSELVVLLPGDPWAKTEEIKKRLEIP